MTSTFFVFLSLLSLAVSNVSASVTVYATTGTAAQALQTPCYGAVPCDGRILTPLADPGTANFSTAVPVQLLSGGMNGLSIQLEPSFAGFSIELSVANQLMGNDGSEINPIFLNLMSTVASRSGKVIIRVGGNTQDLASVVPQGLPGDVAIEKVQVGADKTFTPTLLISPSLIYALGNITEHVPIQWFIGVPFNDTSNPRLEIAEISQAVLGKNLIGLQLGNEPDLYGQNGIRPGGYTPAEYNSDWGLVLSDYINDAAITNKTMFVAPSVCCGGGAGWTPEQVFDTGFLTTYATNLAYISVQHYPNDNCNDSTPIDPQTLLPTTYLNHQSTQGNVQIYLNTSQTAQSVQKPLLMFETNTASCGGFSGLSDSFAATLWAIDYGLNLASANFSAALFHVGGVSDYYNPFTVPATNQSRFRQWTIGSPFYANLVIAEALGSSGQAQVVDLLLNNNNVYQPGYAIYENGQPARLMLMNFITDPSGASNYTAYISVGGNSTGQPNATPSSVQVKYLSAPSVSEHFNITWAGQTFGGPFESDGRFQGDEEIIGITCDTGNNVCSIPVPAPGAALVFLNGQAFSESEPAGTTTFATTTTATGAANTATVPQAVLATSNGRGGGMWNGIGSTSFGSRGNGAMSVRTQLASGAVYASAALFGALLVIHGFRG